MHDAFMPKVWSRPAWPTRQGRAIWSHRNKVPESRPPVRTPFNEVVHGPPRPNHMGKHRERMGEIQKYWKILFSVSLDYANRWRGQHTESACHGDRKSCSAQHEISSTGRRYRRFPVRRPNSSPGAWSRAADAIPYRHPFAQTGITFRSVIEIAYKTPIWNRHSEAPVAPLLPLAIRRRFRAKKPSFCTPKLRFRPTIAPIPRSQIWVYQHRRYSHPLPFIPTPSAKELAITFRPGIEIAYVTTIRNRHYETVDRALVSRDSVPGVKFCRGACVLVHRSSYPSGRTRIFVRPGIRTARESPIQNPHFDPIGRGYLFARGSEPPARPQFGIRTSTRSPQGRIRRFPVPSARDLLHRSQIWVNQHRRYSHPLPFIPTPSSKELAITFRPGIGVACVTTIQNRHSKTVDMALVSWDSVLGVKFRRGACVLVHRSSYPSAIRRRFGVEKPSFRTPKLRFRPTIALIPRFFGSSVSLDYANRWRGQHMESACHGDRKSCSAQHKISSTGRRYGCTNIADIVTPLIWVHQHRRYGHPLLFIPTPSANELAITFCPGIGIAYVTTIRNRHSETIDRELVSRDSVSWVKFRRGACVLVHRSSYPSGRTQIFVGHRYLFARGSEPPTRPEFGIHTSTRSPQGHIRRFSVRHPNSSLEALSRAADAIAYGHPFAQTGITFRSVIGIAFKTPIRNRHSEAPVAPLSPQAIGCRFGAEKSSFRTMKLRFRPTIALISKFSGSSISLDYANHWRGQHTESACHDDRKSCSTQHEISSTGRRYGCTNIADIVTPSRLFPPLRRKELAITFRPGIRIAYVTTIRNRHSETVDRELVSRDSVPWVKFPRGAYGCTNIADIVTPPVYSHPFSERTGHNFPPEHRNRLCDHNSESTLRDGRQGVGFAGFRSVGKIPPRSVCTSTPIVVPLGSVSLDYANRWRGQHTESACHGDRKSCSAQHEISSTGRRYGCTNIADIVTPSCLFPPLQRKNWP
ncbi:hypothetical protein Taro_000827 [Colocasia esculenta]|uniref:Uncharacterized protein n=1 Tax=Colocasia esculenta TaxID=4460 RepID=A0A843TGF6_COLES|nr:hypothetical protein [Colocasia esculenta]